MRARPGRPARERRAQALRRIGHVIRQRSSDNRSDRATEQAILDGLIADGWIHPDLMPSPFCDSCLGPFRDLTDSTGGHWDTCPNRTFGKPARHP